MKIKAFESDESFVNTLFQMTLGHKITCLDCKRSRMNFNMEYNLAIELVGNPIKTSFNECLSKFFESEIL